MVRIALALGLVGVLLLSAGSTASATTPTPDTVIDVGDFWFCDPSFQNGVCETTVSPGDTVQWDFSAAGPVISHTTTECGANCDNPTATPLWDSDLQFQGDTFKFTFDDPGQYLYYCEVHPQQMRGIVNVGGVSGPVGDANCDGEVNAVDAALILQQVAALTTVPCPDEADATQSNGINAIDAAVVLQFVAGLIPSLPP